MAVESAWTLLSREPKEPVGVLSDAFVLKFSKYLNWDLLSQHYDFSIDMLRIYMHRVNWSHLVKRMKFDESFLREAYPNFSPECWSLICKYQKLSEPFIHTFSCYVDWDNIALYQKVSGRFLQEHSDLIKKNHCLPYNDDVTLMEID